jgi:hypothetical protein
MNNLAQQGGILGFRQEVINGTCLAAQKDLIGKTHRHMDLTKPVSYFITVRLLGATCQISVL